MSSSMMDDVFELLAVAKDLEKDSRIEAATKYYEAIHLMQRFLQRLPQTAQENATRDLIEEKVRFYGKVAADLMADDSSTTALWNNPRSPIEKASFFSSDASVIPIAEACVIPIPAPLPPASGSSVLQPAISLSPRTSQKQHVMDSRVSQANQKLARALDLDEAGDREKAIKVYMEAAETYLQALQMLEQNADLPKGNVAATLKRRLESTLDRVETLKHPKPSQQKKTVIPHSRQADEQNDSSISSKSKSASSLTSEEIEILKQSSLIASGLFLPWSDEDATRLLRETKKQSGKLFIDPDGFLPLSDKQRKHFFRWARPSEIVQLRHQLGITRNLQKPVMVNAITPYTIKQQYVTDCSFIASLCICAAFERRFRKRLITSILHPQVEGRLLYNPNGKYMVKLWLNGVARAVVIDDYLPIDKYGNLLCSSSSRVDHATHLELWVCLIEKAFLKLSGGGYGFPGSTSGIDLFSLTGWIPESILFAKNPDKVRDFETPPERAWERIFSASSYGDCLITVSSTNSLKEEEADAVGIVTGHAYAVLSVVETKDGIRLLQLKNPWAHQGWKGRYSSRDSANWTPQLRAEVGYNPDLAAKQDDGVFWICWQDVLRYFENFHLSWNPWLFSHRATIHGLWPKEQGPEQDTYNIGENPQFTLELSDAAVKKNPSIWVLLSRHVTKDEQTGGQIEDYLTVHLHRNTVKKERIWYPSSSGNCILNGAYTNSPQVLVRYDVTTKEDKYLTLVLSQYKKFRDVPYTLSVFATENFLLSRPPKDLEFEVELNSAWVEKTAGGPCGRESFGMNPQFAVEVPPGGATLEVRLSSSRAAAINVMLAPVSKYGDGIQGATGEPVLDTGNYRHGFAVTKRKHIKSGSYVLIASNYTRGQKAVFQVKLCSSAKLRVAER